MDIDSALAAVGGYRRWHLAMFSFLGIFGFLPLCWQGIVIVFLGISPPHHCKLPEGMEASNATLPWVTENKKSHWHKCAMYANYSLDNNTVECTDGWTYDKEDWEVSIVTEWDLVCDKDYMSDLSQTIYQVGALIGEVLSSVVIDKFGRKKVFVIGSFLTGVCGTVVSFSPNYTVFCVTRAITAISVLMQCWSAETQMMELFDSKRRAFAGIGLEILWVIDYLLLAGIAYLLRDWRHLQLAISLSVLPALISIWILPESPMWLVANGRVEEAEKVLQDIARFNKVKVPGRLLAPSSSGEQLMSDTSKAEEQGQEDPTEERSSTESELPVYPWSTLFTNRRMLMQTIVTSILWFANSVVYYALILASPSMPGGVYLNFTLGALVEIPAYIITYLIVITWGRRLPTIIIQLFAGTVLGLLAFIPEKTASGMNLSPLIITMALMGKFAITISIAIFILYAKEIFPTNLRVTSGGVTALPARLGTMAAPFASYAANRTPWLPQMILAFLSLFAAAITFILPETMYTPLPQTIGDVEVMYANHKTFSCLPPKATGKSTQVKWTRATEDTNSNEPM